MFLELWNHGLAAEPSKPCGEVDVFNISGDRIAWDVIELLNERSSDWMIDCFGNLPVDVGLRVEVEEVREEGSVYLDVLGWDYLPEPSET